MSSTACTTKSSDEILHPFYWHCIPNHVSTSPKELYHPTILEQLQDIVVTAGLYIIHTTCLLTNIYVGYIHTKTLDTELKNTELKNLEIIGALKGAAVGILGIYYNRPIGTSIAMFLGGTGGASVFKGSTIEWLLGAPSLNKPFRFGFAYAAEGISGFVSAILITPPLNKERDTTASLTDRTITQYFEHPETVRSYIEENREISLINPDFLFRYGNSQLEAVRIWKARHQSFKYASPRSPSTARHSDLVTPPQSPHDSVLTNSPRTSLSGSHISPETTLLSQFIKDKHTKSTSFFKHVLHTLKAIFIIHILLEECNWPLLPNVCIIPLENNTISTKKISYLPISYDTHYLNSSYTLSKFSSTSQNACETLCTGFACCPPANIIEQGLLGIITVTTTIIIGKKYSQQLPNDNGILVGATIGLVSTITNHHFSGIILMLLGTQYTFQCGFMGALCGISGFTKLQLLNYISPLDISYSNMPFTEPLLKYLHQDGIAILQKIPFEENWRVINSELLALGKPDFLESTGRALFNEEE